MAAGTEWVPAAFFDKVESFRPFGMKDSFFAAKEDTDKRFAEGYFYGKDGRLKKNIYSFPPIGTADSGAYTTVQDLDRFWRYVSESPIYRKMLLPHTNVRKEEGAQDVRPHNRT